MCTSVVFPDVLKLTRSSYTYVNIGSDASDAAEHLKTAVTSDHGHGAKITGGVSTAEVTLTQATTGKAGNTLLITANNLILS